MITFTVPTIQVEFNVSKVEYHNFFRSYWFGYIRGKGIKNFTPSENGDYTNIALTVDVSTARDICRMLSDLWHSNSDIDYVDIKRIWHECDKAEGKVVA